MRTKLPGRRSGFNHPFIHNEGLPGEIRSFLTINYDAEYRIKEVFCADPRVGSDIHGMLTDICILISLHLQTGAEPERLVRSLGENREEGKASGPPSSIVGAIARAILEIQTYLNEELTNASNT